MLTIIELLGGIAGLYVGSTFVLGRLPRVARALGVSELVVTVLGVSILTSLPELAVSGIASATQGQEGAVAAIGNVLGSNFVTLTLVLSICALVRPFRVSTTIRDRETIWMILCSAAVLFLAAADGNLSRVDGGLLIALYAGYAVPVIREAAAQRGVKAERGRLRALDLLLVFLGIGLVVGGGELTVLGGTELGLWAGLSPLAVGVIIFAAGTSLPELSVALQASVRGKSDVVLGEVYASNIFTGFVVLGICLLIQPLDVVPATVLGVDLPMLILGAALVQLFVTTGLVYERWEAIITVLFYAYYVYQHVG